MTKRNFFILLLLAFHFSSSAIVSLRKDTVHVRTCTVPLPDWWQEVPLTLPDTITSLPLLQTYAHTLKNDSAFGNKRFIKAMFLGVQQLNIFPAYIGDAYHEIGMYDEAIAVYEKIIPCAANEKGRSDEWKCYLYYMIGKCYEEKKDKENALIWYRKAVDKKFEKGNKATVERYKVALCAYRCLMNIRCDL